MAEADVVRAARAASDPVAGLQAIRRAQPSILSKDAGRHLRTAFPWLTPRDVGLAFGSGDPEAVLYGLRGAFGAGLADRPMLAVALAADGRLDAAGLATAMRRAVGDILSLDDVGVGVGGAMPLVGVAGLVAAMRAVAGSARDDDMAMAVARAMPQVTTASVVAAVGRRPDIRGGAPRLPADVMSAIGSEALAHVGLLSPRDPSRGAADLAKALFADDLAKAGVPGAMAGRIDAAASSWADGMSRRSKDAIGGIVKTTVRGISGQGMSEALARPIAGVMHDVVAPSVSRVAGDLFGGVLGAAAGTVLPVVGPLAAGLVSWGLGSLFGKGGNKVKPPLPVAEATYLREFGPEGGDPMEGTSITPSLVLGHLFRACMRWHRAAHPAPVAMFTDWRAAPPSIDFASPAWTEPGRGERVVNWWSRKREKTHFLGPWTPSAYGPAFRLAYSGVTHKAAIKDRGLRSTPGSGAAVTWRDESIRPGEWYRFSHDVLAEFTGLWNQALSDAIARSIASAFAWGEERPHLQAFRPFLKEIGWAEFICASALIDWHSRNDLTLPMAMSKTSAEVVPAAMAGPWERGAGGGEAYVDELHSRWGADPTGSGLAALCFVTAEIRRFKIGDRHVAQAGMDARAAAAAIAAEDQKARMDLVSAMKSAPPPPAAMAATAALQSRAETADRTAADAKEALRRAEEALRSAEEARSSRAGTVRAAGVGLAVLAGGLLVSRALKGDR